MTFSAEEKPKLVIVTGLSGAGKSIAIKALEDLSFYCIDNVPVEIVDHVISFFLKPTQTFKRVALGMDIRGRNFADQFIELKERISKKVDLDVLFLTCSDEILTRRYSTTRRKHPVIDEGGELLASIRREASLLRPVEEAADIKMDTSSWSPHYLARVIEERYKGEKVLRKLYVTVVSFGFKYGALRPADSIYDVRFLNNPYFDLNLRDKTGLESDVRDYIFKDDRTTSFLDKLLDFHRFLLPEYYNEGKHYFRLGIGCTGGRHRSVALAEALAKALAEEEIENTLVSVAHRDVNSSIQPFHSL